ncbi:MAG: hypothetical protein IKL14_00915 [Alphaproteobacteria bacterium]|nr:hypothetical protein [Alphaproteobacteria bacterium]
MSQIIKNSTLCGLWGVDVNMSEHNRFGKCECVGCIGSNCKNCVIYHELYTESANSTFNKQVSRCKKCRTAEFTKQR